MSIFNNFRPPTRNQVVALAGVFQACKLVEITAQTGTSPSDEFATSIHSVFEQNPRDTDSIFSGVSNLRLGFEAMQKSLNLKNTGTGADTLRYAIGVTQLQRILLKNKAMLNKLGKGINNAAMQAEHFGETHENVIANLAALYQDTLSTFNYRIQVNGQATHLQQPAVANRIRALLLAGVRSSVLWHQLGGSRWQLMFHRKQLQLLLDQLRKDL